MEADKGKEEDIVGVFEDEERAAAAAERAGTAASGADVRVGDARDERAALRGEMREETEHVMAAPGNVGPFTKEMTKGIVLCTLLCAGVGVVLALVLGFLPVAERFSLWGRVVVAVLIGGFAGATVGFVVGGGFAAKGPGDKLASERGVAVGVTVEEAQAGKAAEALAEQEPIRVDVMRGEGRPVTTVATEEERTSGGVVDDLQPEKSGGQGGGRQAGERTE